MKLNREQIIKALEICGSYDDQCAYCCPYAFKGCARELAKDVLALYRERTEENERLKAENELVMAAKKSLKDMYDRDVGSLVNTIERLIEVKSDTVRKMQERLKECFFCDSENIRNTDAYVRDVVDQIAQEILEGVKDEDSGVCS